MADITADFQTVSGRTALAQALIRRWSTPRGRLIDDPNYGTDIAGLLNDDMSQSEITRLRAAAEAEAEKDERVVSISSNASFNTVTGALTLDFSVVDGAGPFALSVSVNSVTVDLLQVSP